MDAVIDKSDVYAVYLFLIHACENKKNVTNLL